MPEFRPYEGFCCKVRRESKATKKHIDLKQSIIEMAKISILVSNSPADYFTCMFEWMHYFKSHYVVQVSDDLAKALLNSKLKLKIDQLRLPHAIFEINFDTRTRIEGYDFALPGLLVCTSADNKLDCDEFALLTDMPSHGLQPIAEETLLSIRHGCPDSSDTFTPMYNCNIRKKDLEDKEIEQIVDEIGTIYNGTPFDEKEKKLQKYLCHLVMGVICYLHMEEPEIEPAKANNRPRIGDKPANAFILGKHTLAGSFFRKAHFRRLMHERFKRKEDGGFRTIWIKEHEVNKGRESANAEKKIVNMEVAEP